MAISWKRTDPVRLFVRRLGIVALLVLLIAAISALWDVYKKERESRVLREQAEFQLATLTEQESHLAKEIARLETARGKEERLREHYEMGRAGENVIIIVEPPAPEPVAATSAPALMEWARRFIPFF